MSLLLDTARDRERASRRLGRGICRKFEIGVKAKSSKVSVMSFEGE
jgi:hypothetical protein